jgi:bis(5'-nucleosyl)-tetraphosphatase (symmetrical)
MAVYGIGDVQGCHAELLTLLELLRFDPRQDQLWLTGDLVNRGPNSLDVLRFVRGLGDAAVSVLGNHDLHLLAVWAGTGRLRQSDTLERVLSAPDCDQLLDWLRQRPLLHHDAGLGWVMTHAGISPRWSLDEAIDCAAEVETALRSIGYRSLLERMYGNQPARWDPELQGWKRLRHIVNVFTRMRYCDADGGLLFDYKGAPGRRPSGYYPWFETPERIPMPEGVRLVSGHWSTLGLLTRGDVHTIDTGCLWGGALTALRLDGELRITQLPCQGARKPT